MTDGSGGRDDRRVVNGQEATASADANARTSPPGRARQRELQQYDDHNYDAQGNTIAGHRPARWGSRAREVDALCSPVAAGDAAKRAAERNMRTLEVEWRDRAPGVNQRCAHCRQPATITSIRDVTPIPHNGCRPRKRRRV